MTFRHFFPCYFTLMIWESAWKTGVEWGFQHLPDVKSLDFVGNSLQLSVDNIFNVFQCYFLLMQLICGWATALHANTPSEAAGAQNPHSVHRETEVRRAHSVVLCLRHCSHAAAANYGSLHPAVLHGAPAESPGWTLANPCRKVLMRACLSRTWQRGVLMKTWGILARECAVIISGTLGLIAEKVNVRKDRKDRRGDLKESKRTEIMAKSVL